MDATQANANVHAAQLRHDPMTPEDIERRIRTFMRATFFVMNDLPDGQSFLESGVVDSTGMIELVEFAQQAFAIVIDDSELVPENLDSLSRLTAFIVRKRLAAGA